MNYKFLLDAVTWADFFAPKISLNFEKGLVKKSDNGKELLRQQTITPKKETKDRDKKRYHSRKYEGGESIP